MNRFRAFSYIFASLLAAIVVFWAIATKNRTYEGILQHGFERSDFYPRGDCSASPYWFEAKGEAADQLNKRWVELGRPNGLRLRFVGDLTHIGLWGHLGKYKREIQAFEHFGSRVVAGPVQMRAKNPGNRFFGR